MSDDKTQKSVKCLYLTNRLKSQVDKNPFEQSSYQLNSVHGYTHKTNIDYGYCEEEKEFNPVKKLVSLLKGRKKSETVFQPGQDGNSSIDKRNFAGNVNSQYSSDRMCSDNSKPNVSKPPWKHTTIPDDTCHIINEVSDRLSDYLHTNPNRAKIEAVDSEERSHVNKENLMPEKSEFF